MQNINALIDPQIQEDGNHSQNISETIQPSIQEESIVDIQTELKNVHGESSLTEDQRKLLKEIFKDFSPQDNAADLGILFEVTGFQANAKRDQFWENYKDFNEPDSTNLVWPSKNEESKGKDLE